MITTVTTARKRVAATTVSVPVTWTALDTALAFAWMLVGIVARVPLVARIEGALDHDQSIVGLMTLDIAAGRRWPLFFDGQRYMGAVESYVAALFVTLFGHSPAVVALAPLLFFGLFAAGQYVLWRKWGDRTTGHLAALITVVSAPMFALWSIVPRGGYIEILVWALPVLAVYRRVSRPGGAPRSPWGQAGWGFLLAVGYFLNPLSLILYLTMMIDWTLGRHGADLRRERGLEGPWFEWPRVPWVWTALAVSALVGLALCCHVDFARGVGGTPFIFLMGWQPRALAAPLGVVGLLAIVALAAWWSGAGVRTARYVAGHAWFTLGVIAALTPFLLNNLLVYWGRLPWNQSLPIWIRAPWTVGVNVQTGGRALGPLVGCSPEAPETLLFGQGVELPVHVWPLVSLGLAWLSPLVVALVVALVATLAWHDRAAWRRFWTLRGNEPTPPTVLMLLALGVMSALYLLQVTSPNASSMRYLVPTWIVLPGLIASALRRLPAPRRNLAGALLLLPWATAQVSLGADMARPSPHRVLTRALERRGEKAIVAQTPVALIVANLSQGRVGTIEYRPLWHRLRDRYATRFRPEGPVTCVVDLDFPWQGAGGFRWPARQDLGRDLRALAARHPGRVRMAERVSHFEIWEVDLPLSAVLTTEDPAAPPAPGAVESRVPGP